MWAGFGFKAGFIEGVKKSKKSDFWTNVQVLKGKVGGGFKSGGGKTSVNLVVNCSALVPGAQCISLTSGTRGFSFT